MFFRQRLSRNHLITGLVFVALFSMAVRYPAAPDTWWHLLTGQKILQGGWLYHDPFSHTRLDHPWINHGWLGQVFWAALLNLGGWAGLGLGLATLVMLSFGLMWRLCRGNVYINAFLIILAAIASSIIWSARPQMLSFFFSAVALTLLYRFKRGQGRLLPWFPLLVLLWVNTHGGFAIAFILLVCFALGELFNRITRTSVSATDSEAPSFNWRQFGLTTGLSLAVVPLNPNGPQMWLYPFRTVGIGALRDFIAEWQSPNFHAPLLQVFLVLVLLALAALARSSHKLDWTDLALLGAWLTLGLLAVRNVPLFALLTLPVLSKIITEALEAQFGPLRLGRPAPTPAGMSRVHKVVLLLALLAALGQSWAVLNPTAIQAAEAERFPQAGVAYVQATQPPGPMFNSYNIGGYLMYQLWPDYPVYVDGRTDLYDDAFLQRYLQLEQAQGNWAQMLNDSNLQLVIIEAWSPLGTALQQEPAWVEAYRDEQLIVYTKRIEGD